MTQRPANEINPGECVSRTRSGPFKQVTAIGPGPVGFMRMTVNGVSKPLLVKRDERLYVK